MFITGGSKSLGLLIGTVFIVIGITFLAAPNMIATTIALLVGALITTVGLFRVASVVSRWQFLHNRVAPLIIGLLTLGAGLFMLFNPGGSMSFIGIIIGIFAILMAINYFITANRLKREMTVTPMIITGLVHLVFGLGMIYAAMVVVSIIIAIIGFYLLASGLMIILSSFYFHNF